MSEGIQTEKKLVKQGKGHTLTVSILPQNKRHIEATNRYFQCTQPRLRIPSGRVVGYNTNEGQLLSIYLLGSFSKEQSAVHRDSN